jgi:hypothetical protein
MKSLFLYSKLLHLSMKKIAIILVMTFITALVISSCNREACPAYSNAETEHSCQVG